jgi:hypothetical protein
MIYFLPAALLLIIGWFTKYKKVTWLISGYNTLSKEEKQKYDIEKLCKYTGNFIFILAGIMLIMGIVSVAGVDPETVMLAGFPILAVAIICGIVYLNTGNRVKKD